MRSRLPARPVDQAAVIARGRPAASAPLRRLHLNESPYPPSANAIAAMAAAVQVTNRYPDSSTQALCAELSARTGIAAAHIVCGHGSEELINVLCTLGLRDGDEVVLPAPTFPGIPAAVGVRNSVGRRVELDAQGANDADAMLAAITAQTRIVFCCTPNPPSGGLMKAEALQRLAQHVPDHVLLVVDEAYHEFGRHAGGPDVLAILRQRRGPWVDLRTFSKAYSLAGARVGYALCSSADVAGAIRHGKTMYGPSTVPLAGALAALRDDAHLAGTLDAVARERTRMAQGMASLGLRPMPTAANFVSVAMPMPAVEAMTRLHEMGILVRDWRDADHRHEIRVTVGTADDTDALLHALGVILQPTGATAVDDASNPSATQQEDSCSS
jgi:histidinol-phosphate aminotransferase